MSKQLFVDPALLRKPGSVHFDDIPVNTYQKSVKDEVGHLSNQKLIEIYRDMLVLREFETMLNLIKTTGEYKGIAYNHPGPAHLSMGQEASAVGMAFHLDENDFIFGSHRSHGEILAKGLSAIEKLSDDALLKIMREFFGGDILKAVDNGSHASVKALAIDFLVYGAIAEIFARSTGFNRGLGGSMHTFFTPFGIFPNNAIVGGSGTIAAGAALYKKVNRKKGIVVANIGDGSLGCGPVLEALNFASMGQFTTLWEGDMKAGLPVLFNIFNNNYGMGGQTVGEDDGLRRAGAPRRGLLADPDARRSASTASTRWRSSKPTAARRRCFRRARARCFWTCLPTASPVTARRTPPPTAHQGRDCRVGSGRPDQRLPRAAHRSGRRLRRGLRKNPRDGQRHDSSQLQTVHRRQGVRRAWTSSRIPTASAA